MLGGSSVKVRMKNKMYSISTVEGRTPFAMPRGANLSLAFNEVQLSLKDNSSDLYVGLVSA